MKKHLQQRIKNSTSALFKRAAEFVFPALCIVCDNSLTPKNNWFCQNCLNLLKTNRENRKACSLCSQNLDISNCTCELAWDYPFTRIFSIYDFNETIRAVTHLIKYKGKKKLAFELGSVSNSSVPPEMFDETEICIPVPLHSSRIKSRGFNQSEWFARGILFKKTKIEITNDLLIRKRKTETQTRLNKQDRKKNLQDAFIISTEKCNLIRGKKILLVDDVVTTGATTEACASALLQGGCSSVSVLSVARD